VSGSPGAKVTKTGESKPPTTGANEYEVVIFCDLYEMTVGWLARNHL
jgi:hypothetical protein